MFKHLMRGRITQLKQNGYIVVVNCQGQLIKIKRDMYHPIVYYQDQFIWGQPFGGFAIPMIGSQVVIEWFSDADQTLHLKWTTRSQLLQALSSFLRRVVYFA